MKKILLLFVFAISVVALNAQGRHAFGVELNQGYGAGGTAFGFGVKYHHFFNDDWRATGSVRYQFAGENILNIDANINYLFEVGTSGLDIYPLAGIGSFKRFGHDSYSRFMINLGAGVDYALTDNWYLNGEIKLGFFDKVRETVAVGIMYRF
ncbi:MAG: porin family protein [Bacteroidales bacterium]|nr:porin family protein [Bacteroidales bacterium]